MTAGSRDLKKNLGHYLREVKRGARYSHRKRKRRGYYRSGPHKRRRECHVFLFDARVADAAGKQLCGL